MNDAQIYTTLGGNDQRWMNHLPGNDDGAKVARSPRWQRKGGETWEAQKRSWGMGNAVMFMF